jgi:hypothetical protein
VISQPERDFALYKTPLASQSHAGIVDRVGTPDPSLPPDPEDLRGLARGLRLLIEIGARTLAEDAGPSELALRVTGGI